jgi:type IV pilus assembly protein PilO
MSGAERPPTPKPSRREALAAQFRGLDPREPGTWPALARLAACAGAFLLVLVVGALAVLSQEASRLQREREREPVLQQTYKDKLAQAVHLTPLRQRKQTVQQQVQAQEQQLPGRSEMDALLADVAEAARRRNLVVEGFRPGTLQLREHHAELPVALRLTGQFHDIGGFAADVARLPRIVALHDLQLTAVASPARDSARASLPAATGSAALPSTHPPVQLTFEAVALTYRTLEPAERADSQRRRQTEKAAPRSAPGARP